MFKSSKQTDKNYHSISNWEKPNGVLACSLIHHCLTELNINFREKKLKLSIFDKEPFLRQRDDHLREARGGGHGGVCQPSIYCECIWVRFCRTGIIPVLFLFFFKVEASCHQTWWDIFSFSIDPGQLGLVASRNTLPWPWKKFWSPVQHPCFSSIGPFLG